MVKAADIISKIPHKVNSMRLLGIDIKTISMYGCNVSIDTQVMGTTVISIAKDKEDEIDMEGVSSLCTSDILKDADIHVIKMKKVVNIEHKVHLVLCNDIHVSGSCEIFLITPNATCISAELNIPFFVKGYCAIVGQFDFEAHDKEMYNGHMFMMRTSEKSVVKHAARMNGGFEVSPSTYEMIKNNGLIRGDNIKIFKEYHAE